MKSSLLPKPELEIGNTICGYKIQHRRFENSRWLYGYMHPALGLSWAAYDGAAAAVSSPMIGFEASVLRYRPDVFSGEFANVGLFMAHINTEGAVADFRFQMLTTQTQRLREFFRAVWGDQDWPCWTQAFFDGEERIRSCGTTFESFESIRDAFYAPTSYGCFCWSETITGADASLDTAFERFYESMILRHIIN